MKIILNPKYESLREFLTHLEDHFEKAGQEILCDRNVIRTLQVNGFTLCVKRYAVPRLRTRLAQRLYRWTPKGKKAYFRPLALRERGLSGPEPVAYIKYSKGITRSTHYFVYLHSKFRYTLNDLARLDEEERDELVKALARFMARLHRNGFLQHDITSDRILFDKSGSRYRFSLLDTNRLSIGRTISIEKGCDNLARLSGDERFFATLAHAYALARHSEAEHCEHCIREARRKNGTANIC